MDRDWTLPTWTDLLQLLLKYFLGISLHSRKGFFFFLGLTRSMLTWSTLPGGFYRTVRTTGGPKRCAGQPRAYKSPFGSFQSSFLTFSPLFTSTKISRVILILAGLSFQPQYAISVFAPVFSALEVMFIFPSSSSFYLFIYFLFLQNVSSNTIRKACQIFILFLEFSKSYMLAMIYAMLYAYVLFLIYECVNTREFKC